MNKVSIIMPVYNEAATIQQLLTQVWKQPLPGELKKELVIVESNSKDGTRELVQAFVEKIMEEKSTTQFVQLVLEDAPLGKGHAVRAGLALSSGDIIMIQDGDLEYDVSDYPGLLEPILEGKTRLVLGSRHLMAGSWKIRKFRSAWYLNLGGLLFHGLFNILYGTELTDPTTMYKVFTKDCIKGMKLESNRFDFDFELLAKLIRAGVQPYEVPIIYSSRSFEQGKKVRLFRDPLTWIWAILKFRWSRLY